MRKDANVLMIFLSFRVSLSLRLKETGVLMEMIFFYNRSNKISNNLKSIFSNCKVLTQTLRLSANACHQQLR